MGAAVHEWVWAAVAAGDVTAVRAAPASFDINGLHPRYGTVLTAFLQALLNVEGRFAMESNMKGRIRELVEELGRRGARPDMVVPAASIEVRGLYRDWRFAGDVTAMQVVIQMRNDLIKVKFDEGEDNAADDAELLNEVIDRYAEFAARGPCAARVLVPEAVVNCWQRCLEDQAAADLVIVAPDGKTRTHALLLRQSSPVVAAMLSAGMCEGEQREVRVQESTRVVELFLRLLYTGCVPPEPELVEGPELKVNLRVAVRVAFRSNSARGVLLPMGLGGEVHVMDDDGDALIKFDGISHRQWVKRRNFWCLRLAPAESAVRLQKDLAGALALAHRWQVCGLAEVLAECLEREVCAESFESTLEAAVLHGLGRLQAACFAFAQNSAQVRAAYEAGAYGPTVITALGPVVRGDTGDSRTLRKRQRESL